MGRTKGSKMSEEAKAAMRAKRAAKKSGKDSAYGIIASGLKTLSYDELESVLSLALRYKKEKLGEEELRLIKEKEEIELKLEKLKALDLKINT